MKKLLLALALVLSFAGSASAQVERIGTLSSKVTGPASSTDNAITRFDGTTGKTVQNSAVTIDDSGNMAATVTDTTTTSVLWSSVGHPDYSELNWQPDSDAGVRFSKLGWADHDSNGDLTGTTHYGGVLGYGTKSGTGTDAFVIGTEGRCGAIAGTITTCAALTATFDTNTENAGTMTFGVGFYLPDQTDDGHIGTKFSLFSDDADWTLRNDGPGQFGGTLSPVTTDGAALGSTSLMWSDRFMASGAVDNWNNGDVTLTHSSNTLKIGGGILSATAGETGYGYYPQRVSGRFYLGVFPGQGITTTNTTPLVDDVNYAVAVPIPAPMTIKSVTIRTSSSNASVSGLLKACAYAADGTNGEPGTLIGSTASGTAIGDSATLTQYTINFDSTVAATPPFIYLAFIQDSTTGVRLAALSAPTGNSPYSGGTSASIIAGTNVIYGFTGTGTYAGGCPSPFGTATVNTTASLAPATVYEIN